MVAGGLSHSLDWCKKAKPEFSLDGHKAAGVQPVGRAQL